MSQRYQGFYLCPKHIELLFHVPPKYQGILPKGMPKIPRDPPQGYAKNTKGSSPRVCQKYQEILPMGASNIPRDPPQECAKHTKGSSPWVPLTYEGILPKGAPNIIHTKRVIQTYQQFPHSYGGYPNIQWFSYLRALWRCPNISGGSHRLWRVLQHTRFSDYEGCPNIPGGSHSYGGCPNRSGGSHRL